MISKRTIVAVSLAVCMSLASEAGAQAAGPRVKDSILGIDKLKHFLIAGFVESVAFGGLQAAGADRKTSLAGAGATVVVVSFGREIHGRRTTGLFSLGDLAWSALGGGAAMLVLTRVQR